ncbi:hypothetical protein [Hymenobacter yonginensis]|uniref:Uncharacterized protein n=1 Tax=Hymenobacter yonginensis TaxID=748197 RepID=A0ABY7PTW0_9BACT|nr:hypothetical protein [Hymenobacter yonginensis]WBO86060.1 hypothetical protein O9Z63_07345 [Hymenobacter yonginensis]
METLQAELLPPKRYDFDEGQLQVSLLSPNGLSQIRIEVLAPVDHQDSTAAMRVDEDYPDPQTAHRRYHAFSGADADYWMGNLYLLHMEMQPDVK